MLKTVCGTRWYLVLYTVFFNNIDNIGTDQIRSGNKSIPFSFELLFLQMMNSVPSDNVFNKNEGFLMRKLFVQPRQANIPTNKDIQLNESSVHELVNLPNIYLIILHLILLTSKGASVRKWHVMPLFCFSCGDAWGKKWAVMYMERAIHESKV